MRRLVFALLLILPACIPAEAKPTCGVPHKPPCPTTTTPVPTTTTTLPTTTTTPPPTTTTPTTTPPPACIENWPDPQPMTDVTYTTTVIGCVTISIEDEVTWWTPQQVYQQVVDQAPDLAYLQAHKFQLFIHVRSDPSCCGPGNTMYARPFSPSPPCNANDDYTTCTLVSVITLQANPDRCIFSYNCAGSSSTWPEKTIAHEFGHAWIDYFKLKYHGGTYDEYVAQRNLEPGSFAALHPQEAAAEDYRICFGTPVAVGNGIPDPDGAAPPTPEQCAFLANTWRVI